MRLPHTTEVQGRIFTAHFAPVDPPSAINTVKILAPTLEAAFTIVKAHYPARELTELYFGRQRHNVHFRRRYNTHVIDSGLKTFIVPREAFEVPSDRVPPDPGPAPIPIGGGAELVPGSNEKMVLVHSHTCNHVLVGARCNCIGVMVPEAAGVGIRKE